MGGGASGYASTSTHEKFTFPFSRVRDIHSGLLNPRPGVPRSFSEILDICFLIWNTQNKLTMTTHFTDAEMQISCMRKLFFLDSKFTSNDSVHKSGIKHFQYCQNYVLQHLINGYLITGSIHSTVTE